MPDHCFAYGSLMCEDIMTRVSGVMLRGEAAQLPGHARRPVQGEDYPGMVPALGLAVSGILYRNLPARAWQRLDDFEGGMYERRRVSVHLGTGETIEAWTYLFRPDLAHLLLAGEWDFQRFLTEGKARFARHYLGFGLLKAHETE